MASGENQGLQIALIVFVSLTIILLATSFLFYRQWDEAADRAEKDAQDNSTKTAALNDAVREIDLLKEKIGLPQSGGAAGGNKLDELNQMFNQDMQQYAATVPADKQHYRDVLQFLTETISTLNQQLMDEQAKKQDLMDKHEQREKAKDAQINEFAEAQRKASEDLAEERAKFKTELDRLTALSEELNTKVKERDSTMQTKQTEFDTAQKALNSEIATLRARISDLDTKLADVTRQTFEVPDGQIVRVNLASRTVWIDLGSDDALRPQVTFSVYTSDSNDVARFESKGSIEVTRIHGPKLAEARILTDTLANPMGRGDFIFTPIWSPGQHERFALAGFFDVNKDGKSDRQMIRDLITLSGGTVDAELDDDGKRTGNLSIDTRYLVVGEEPKGDAFKQYTALLSEAKTFGVAILTLEKFLDHVGFRDPKRLLNFETGQPDDFVRDRPDGGFPVSRGQTTELFRQRTPPNRRAPVPSAP